MKKIKIMKSRPEVSDEEIQKYMNFDKLLLDKDKYLTKTKYQRSIRGAAIGVAVIGVVALIYFTQDFSVSQNTVNSDDSRKISEPKPIDRQLNAADSLTTPGIPKETNTEAVSSQGGTQEPVIARTTPAAKSDQEKPKPEEDRAANTYVQAEPLNGYPDLYAYFERELKYPDEAVKDSITGVVTVVFTINTNGKAENIQVENSLGYAFDKEVKRVLEQMPSWSPATYNGSPVKSKVSIPLTFELKKEIPQQ